MGDCTSTKRSACRHDGVMLHRAETLVSHRLFARAHSGRYFGGLWYKIFTERGPC